MSLMKLRNSTLTALLAASACGDDGGSGEGHDAGAHDAATGGGGDASARHDAAALDGATGHPGAIDASVLLDSGARDASPDANGDELAQALKIEGVQATLQRADLLIAALCHATAVCRPGTIDEDTCILSSKHDWSDPMLYEDPASFDCIDAQLDQTACGVTAPCDQPRACTPLAKEVATRCSAKDGGS